MEEAESDIASRTQVFSMLRENVWERDDIVPGGRIPDSVISGHLAPPAVRFSDALGPEKRNATLTAIDNINAWLPWEKHITVGDDYDAAEIKAHLDRLENTRDPNVLPTDETVVEAAAAQKALDQVLGRNDILVNYFSEFDFNVCGAGAGGCATNFGIEVGDNITSINTVQHELLHAMGLAGGRTCYETFGENCDKNSSSGPMYYYSHVPVADFPESEMAYPTPHNPINGLSQIDGEVLQIIYTREGLWGGGRYFLITEGRQRLLNLEPNRFEIGLDDLSIESMGPWDDAVVRYEGSFSRSIWPSGYGDYFFRPSFGVDWRNGMARPWANGEITHGTFADSGLSGSATWNGELVGFTPRREAVHGDSAI